MSTHMQPSERQKKGSVKSKLDLRGGNEGRQCKKSTPLQVTVNLW